MSTENPNRSDRSSVFHGRLNLERQRAVPLAQLRYLRELPDLRTGLSPVGRLILEIAREAGPPTSGRAFGELTRNREPLPYLGDTMFRWMARSLAAGMYPCSVSKRRRRMNRGFRAAMQPTATGARVEWWETNRLDLGQRWLGGVAIPAERAT